MTSLSNSNRRISYAQVAGNPATPSMKSIRIRSWGVTRNVEPVMDPGFNGTRQNGLTDTGDEVIGGNAVTSLYQGAQDDWWAGLMRSAWVNNQLILGDTSMPFLFEDTQTDSPTPYSYSYHNCEFNTVTMSVGRGADTTLDWGIVGRGFQKNDVLLDSTPDPVSALPMIFHKHMNWEFGGSAVKLRSYSVTYGNGLTPEMNLGETQSGEISSGKATCTFQFSVLASSGAPIVEAAMENNRSLLRLTAEKSSRADHFNIPNAFITSWTKPFDNEGVAIYTFNGVGDPHANGPFFRSREV